jgi:hypothetical protein
MERGRERGLEGLYVVTADSWPDKSCKNRKQRWEMAA